MNVIKEIYRGEPAKSKLNNGAEEVYETVASTFGYRGRLVLVENMGGLPEATKDGYNVLKEIYLDCPIENLACEILKEASEKQMKEAGDGTTQVIVLAHALIKYADIEIREKNRSPIDVKLEMERARNLVIAELEKLSIKITDELILNVAMTSANFDSEIAKIIASAYEKAGDNGIVSHTRSDSNETYLENIDGTLVDSGYADEQFVNSNKEKVVLFDNNPLVIVSHINFKTSNQIFPFLEYAAKNQRQIIIVSEMEAHLRNTILTNKLSGKLQVAIVNVPSYGQKRKDFLNDLALICGTSPITSLSVDNFVDTFSLYVGSVKQARVNEKNSIFIPSDSLDYTDINDKVDELKSIMNSTNNSLERNHLSDRISRLSGKVCVVKVGGVTESELKEKIDRVDDAIRGVRSAKEEGVVAGGGSALFYINSILDNLGEPMAKALIAPLFKIRENAGIKSILTEDNYPIGYDVKEFKSVDMLKAGIVDSVKVIRCALENAVSVAGTIIMVDNVIIPKREKQDVRD